MGIALSSASAARSLEAAEHLKPLSPGNKSRDVLDALAGMIDAAGLTIGDRLPPEVEIAARLGISRAKVREALNAWQNMGLVTRNKRAGTRLAAEISSNAIQIPLTVKVEAESLLRTLAVRRPLELEGVKLAATHVTKAQSRTIIARVSDMMDIYDAGGDWREADAHFHRAVLEATGNPLFGQIIQQIQQGFHEIYEAPFGQPHMGAATIPLHPDLAEAVVAGQASRAMDLIQTILDMVEAEVRGVIGAGHG